MIQIDLLKNHTQCIPALAAIWHEVLGSIWSPGTPSEQVIQRFQGHCNEESLPITFVALNEGKPVGMCSLRVNDGIREDLMPWLGSLVISPEYQKRGIATLLIDAVKHKAKELGFKTLYLFAYDPTIPNYYARLGWRKMGMDVFKGHPVTVMNTDL